MKRLLFGTGIVCLCAFAIAAGAATAQTQTEKSSIEFVVRATPTGGVEEPVRGFPVFLLNRSFEEIQQEAEAAFPKQKLDDFIDGLEQRGFHLEVPMAKKSCGCGSSYQF